MTTTTIDSGEALRLGVRACREGRWRQGLRLLTSLDAEGQNSSPALPGLYYSYLGHAISRVEGRRHDGVELCRHAVEVQFYQPENHLNLAYTYLYSGNRRLAVRAMKEGFALDPHHAGLEKFALLLGVRQPPPLPFLSRSNPVNRLLGTWRHRSRKAYAAWQRRRAGDEDDFGLELD